MKHEDVAWITGAGGLIGHRLICSAPELAPHWRARGLTRADVDLLDFAGVAKLFRKERPALVIHCAAVSRSPVCQANRDLAYRTNVEATRVLSDLAAGIPFLFFSSDLVFDGARGNYVEADPVNPLSVYAETKVQAEEIVRRHPRHLIVRISLNWGGSPRGDRGFDEEMLMAWRQGKTLNLFVDEFRCPMAAAVTARAIWELAGQNARGTFHLCGSEKVSRFEIGRLLAALHPEVNPKIIATSRKDYSGPPRPGDTSMNCAKVQKLLSFPLPKFSDSFKSPDA